MQIKYITEEQAMTMLAKEIGVEMTVSLMDELASCGVIPAYMVFRPIDTALYPGKRFFLIRLPETEISVMNGSDAEIRALPFPLRKGGTFKVAEWAIWGKGKLPTLDTLTYRVFAVRADGNLDPITDQHFVRRYTQQEVRQAAKNVRQYLAGNGCTVTPHAFCDAFAAFDIEAIGEWRGMSPFSDDPDFISPTRRPPQTAEASAPSSTRCELVMISALVQIVETLSAERGSKYTQGKVAEKILDLFPGGISEQSIKNLFVKANKERKAFLDAARDQNDKLSSVL